MRRRRSRSPRTSRASGGFYFLFRRTSCVDLVGRERFDALTAPPAPDCRDRRSFSPFCGDGTSTTPDISALLGKYLRTEGDGESNRFLLSRRRERLRAKAGVRRRFLNSNHPQRTAPRIRERSDRPAVPKVWNFGSSRLARRAILILALERSPACPNRSTLARTNRPPVQCLHEHHAPRKTFFRKKTILVTAGVTAIGTI